MIDFEWYRSFISIYQHRSVSAAAKARILTQPAMSQHLAALEAEIGEQLFERAPRQMIPTEKGKELYTKVVPLIEKLESVSLEMQHEANQKTYPVIRVGAPAEYFTYAALPKIKEMEARFVARFHLAADLIELLKKDEVDIVIATQKLQVTGIEYAKIEEETFVITTPPSYECHAETKEELERWLEQQPWISYGLELPIIRRFFRQHFEKRPDFQATHVLPNIRTILEAVKEGMGISVLPAYLIQEAVKENRVAVLYPEMFVQNTIYVAYKTERKNHPLLQQIITSLRGKQ